MSARALLDGMAATLPALRAFGVVMRGGERGVDAAVARALARSIPAPSEVPLDAWLFRNMRLALRSRKAPLRLRREVSSALSRARLEPEGPFSRLALLGALARLPRDEREAVVLVVAHGFTPEVAGAVCSASGDAMRSRVERGRVGLAEALGMEGREVPAEDARLLS